jgi:hypothetical protein
MQAASIIAMFLVVAFTLADIPPYFIGGYFTSEVDSSSSVLNGIAYFDGKEYQPFQGVTNGIDTSFTSQIEYDSCDNLYVSGNFRNIGGINTGPLAIRFNNTLKWSSLGLESMPTGTPTMKQIISDVSVVCTISCSYCDVYIAGQFSFPTATGEAINIAHYNSKTREWDGMHSASLNINSTAVCNTVVVTTDLKVFVGCSNYYSMLQVYDINSTIWKTFSFGNKIVDQAEVFTLLYDNSIFADSIVVGGNFATVTGCKYLCRYDMKNDDWHFIATIPGWVKTMSWTGSRLYIGGYFQPPIRSISVHDKTMTSLNVPLTIPVLSISACRVGCKEGSAMIGMLDLDEHNHLAYYDANTKELLMLKDGVDGAVNIVSPVQNYIDASSIPTLSDELPITVPPKRNNNLVLAIVLPTVAVAGVIVLVVFLIIVLIVCLITRRKKKEKQKKEGSVSPPEIIKEIPIPRRTISLQELIEMQKREETELELLVRDLEIVLKDENAKWEAMTIISKIESISIQTFRGLSNPLMILAIMNLIETDEFRELGPVAIERMITTINRFSDKLSYEIVEEENLPALTKRDSVRRIDIKKQIVEMVRSRYNSDTCSSYSSPASEFIVFNSDA